ncbi:MAG TPA: enoyl-CoA hydratase/isomerase family protein [Burkholderiales bacterium]|nr:enoyl-CoA hydratase/isomerase family protein [Burkholderiales bacterium]
MGSVSTEIRGAVAVVTFDNAARMNAIDAGIAQGLAAAARALKKRKDVGAMVLRGAGERSFSAGVDLKFVETFPKRAHGFAVVEKGVETFWSDMRAMPFPTIAMLHANCYGGGVQLAASTDFRFGDDVLKLSVPAVKNRLYYPITALERLYTMIGEMRTRRLMLAGEVLAAATLREWGFLDEVFPASGLERETLAFAQKLAEQPRDVVAVYQDIFRALGKGDGRRARALRLKAKARAVK